MTEDDAKAESEKPALSRLLKKFSPMQLALMIGVVLWFYYLVRITTPIPNYDAVTNTIIYAPDSMVVPHNVTFGHAAVGVVIIVILFMTFFTERTGNIDAKEAKRIALKEASYYKDYFKDKEFQGSIELGSVKLRKQIAKSGEAPMPYEWIVGVSVKSKLDESVTWFEAHINPISGMVEGVVLRGDRPIDTEDFCHTCGNLWDWKYVEAEDLKKLRIGRGLIGQTGTR